MTDSDLDEMWARAGVLERLHSDNWEQCPHDRPYERCESCGGEDVFDLVKEVRRLKARLKKVTDGGRCPACGSENAAVTPEIINCAACGAIT